MSSSGIDGVLCSFVFSGYYSVVKHNAATKSDFQSVISMLYFYWLFSHIVHICPLVCIGLAIHCLTSGRIKMFINSKVWLRYVSLFWTFDWKNTTLRDTGILRHEIKSNQNQIL